MVAGLSESGGSVSGDGDGLPGAGVTVFIDDDFVLVHGRVSVVGFGGLSRL